MVEHPQQRSISKKTLSVGCVEEKPTTSTISIRIDGMIRKRTLNHYARNITQEQKVYTQ